MLRIKSVPHEQYTGELKIKNKFHGYIQAHEVNTKNTTKKIDFLTHHFPKIITSKSRI